jgi:hypothetical protein
MHKVWRARPGYDAASKQDDHEETCMQFARIVAAAGIVLGCCNAAVGQAEQSNWVEAQSLRELPPGVQVLLGVGLGAHDGGIADRGDPFNSSDAVAPDSPPQRRFALGLVNGDTALIAVEQGGRGYSVATLEFKQAGTTWQPVRCVTIGTTAPHRGNELLEAFAAHPTHNPLACRLPGAITVAAEPAAGR